MTNRLKIDAPAGVFEIEGDEAFIDAQLDKLLPYVQTCSFGSAPTSAGNISASPDSEGSDLKEAVSETAAANGEDKPKKSRRGKVRAPKGQSCADRMLVLRGKGFFTEKRTTAAIVDGLAKEGWMYKTNQVSASAGQMFDRGDIQRTAEGNGFAYYWDRD